MADPHSEPAPGAPAPDFHLVSHRGDPLTLATWRGVRPVVLYFMREFT
jgi:peroxiredoxin